MVAPIEFSFFSFATTAAIKCCQCFIFRRISHFLDAIAVQVSIVWHEKSADFSSANFCRPIISADFYRSCVIGLTRAVRHLAALSFDSDRWLHRPRWVGWLMASKVSSKVFYVYGCTTLGSNFDVEDSMTQPHNRPRFTITHQNYDPNGRLVVGKDAPYMCRIPRVLNIFVT